MVLTQNIQNMNKIVYPLLLVLLSVSCSSESPDPPPSPIETLYFPPQTSDIWETKSIADLGWKQTAVQPLLDYLALKNSKGFIILVNGRIVLENYNLTGSITSRIGSFQNLTILVIKFGSILWKINQLCSFITFTI